MGQDLSPEFTRRARKVDSLRLLVGGVSLVGFMTEAFGPTPELVGSINPVFIGLAAIGTLQAGPVLYRMAEQRFPWRDQDRPL